MRVVLIEDEPLAAKRLGKLLGEIDPTVEVLAHLESVDQAVTYLRNNTNLDLIFLDIHLSDGNSFEIFDQVQVDHPIIFTTAYHQYTLEAFKQNSIDYLLKPIKKEELEKATSKFKKLHQKGGAYESYQALSKLLQQEKEEGTRKRFMVYAGKKIKSVNSSEIAYCYAESKCVFMVTHQNQVYTLNYTIEKLEELLSKDQFHRVNRKTIVSIESVKEVEPYSKSKIKLNLFPSPCFDVFVPLERMHKFKKWLEI